MTFARVTRLAEFVVGENAKARVTRTSAFVVAGTPKARISRASVFVVADVTPAVGTLPYSARILRQIKALLPKGAAWTRSVGSKLEDLLVGVVDEFARIRQRADDLLLVEMDPRTATETIADWERVFGLPDNCHEAPTDLPGRRAAVTARLISRGGWSGGPSVPFLQSLASALGYELTVRRFHCQPFTCMSQCDDYLYSQAQGWVFVWEFIARHKTNAEDNRLKCQIERYALSSFGYNFAFPLFYFSDGTYTRSGSAVFEHPLKSVQSNLAANTLGTAYVES